MLVTKSVYHHAMEKLNWVSSPWLYLPLVPKNKHFVFVVSPLGKGEMVCIDRCVAKYLDIHEKIGKKLTAMSMQDEDLMKKMSN